LKEKRDALAEELSEVYRDVASRIVNLFGLIAINDKALGKLYRDRPDGVEQYLRSAELHARELESFTDNTPSLLTSSACSIGTPAAKSGHRHGRQWHRHSRQPRWWFVTRRLTADWAKDNDRRAARQ
jgi:hypothetical protein